MDLSPTLYTYSSLSTVYRKFIDANTDLYRNPYPILKPQTPIPTTPSSNTYNLLSDPLRRPPTLCELLRTYQDPLRKPPTLLRTTTDLLKPLTETPYPPTNRYGPTNRFYGPYKTSATRYVLHYTTQYGRY